MDVERLRAIGRKGGLARDALYGNVGTPEGRRKGGLKSIQTHIRNKTGFQVLKIIHLPRRSVRLAELIGILMGDGHVGRYQTSFVTNSETDLQHAQYVKGLFEDIFGVVVTVSGQRDKKSCVLTISSKAVCEYFVTQGIPQGNKIALGITVPKWILDTARYRAACLRGIFDTDGCVYIDTHRVGDKVYRNMGMAFANQSLPLLSFFKESLEILKLHPTQKTEFRVFLRRKEDIRRYFDVVGSSNEKHLKKIRQYFLDSQKGGVA